MKMKHVLVLMIAFMFCFLTGKANAFERYIYVNFSTAQLTVYDASKNKLLQTSVVLPRGNYYRVPVSGTVYRAEMGPTWVPTAKMHRDYPGKYRVKYAPYQKGNAMGHCKLSIDFDSNQSILRSVRIHGNAKAKDLGKRKSRSCIRIPDDLCSTLVANTIAGSTYVYFHW